MSKCYCKIDEKVIKEIEKETLTDTEAEGDLIPVENVESIFEDLLNEIHVLREKLEDIEEAKNDNDHYEDYLLGLM